MTTATKLAALPKAALVELAMRLATERNAARAEADANAAAARRWRKQALSMHEYHRWNAEQVRDIAQVEMDAIGPDPDASRHLDELANEIESYAGTRRAQNITWPRTRRPGPRCHRGNGAPCMKPLNDDGLCSRHDARTIRANRKAAA